MWTGRDESSNVDGVPVQSFGETRAGVMMSMMEHYWAEMGCYIKLLFGKRVMIGHYSCILTYANLYDDEDLDRKYRWRMNF